MQYYIHRIPSLPYLLNYIIYSIRIVDSNSNLLFNFWKWRNVLGPSVPEAVSSSLHCDHFVWGQDSYFPYRVSFYLTL